ncbi:protein SPMIP1 [Aplochiton taeniatus]
MRSLLTTQNQNCYKEQIEKELLTRLTWRRRYGADYPSCFKPRRDKDPTPTRTVLPPVHKAPEKKSVPPLPPPPPLEGEQDPPCGPPLMRPVTPQTRLELFQGFSQEGQGRPLYLHHRTQKAPEDKYDYPVLSSWDYGWRLGAYGQTYKSPASGRSGVVRTTFYARNGIFNIPTETDRLG